MKRHTTIVLALGVGFLGCGGNDAGTAGTDDAAEATADVAASVGEALGAVVSAADQVSDAWVEYQVTGDFHGTGRDEDVVLCSEGGEGQLNIAARGSWYFDMEFDGATAGTHDGKITVTLPEGLDGAPDGVFARRMIGSGTARIGDAGTDGLGFRKVEIEFTGSGLGNDDGQSIDVTGKLACGVFQ